MARANRHYIPGCIWHITYRCHKKEFLLKFAPDRCRFVSLLGEAKCMPSAIQLVAGRTRQEYNQRKRRKGAFWEDRYHATAIESGEHLRRCLVYVDLNMVRASVVRRPAEWVHGGYHEIQGRRRRNTILALDALAEAAEAGSLEALAQAHREWAEAALTLEVQQRDEAWTRSLAVASDEFVLKTHAKLGARGKDRDVAGTGDFFVLRESQESYGDNFLRYWVALVRPRSGPA